MNLRLHRNGSCLVDNKTVSAMNTRNLMLLLHLMLHASVAHNIPGLEVQFVHSRIFRNL